MTINFQIYSPWPASKRSILKAGQGELPPVFAKPGRSFYVVFLKWPQNQVSMFFSSLLKKGASKTRPVYPLVQDGFKKASKQAGFEKTEKTGLLPIKKQAPGRPA